MCTFGLIITNPFIYKLKNSRAGVGEINQTMEKQCNFTKKKS